MQRIYNKDYWDKKVDGYSNQEWSKKPSPFLLEVEKYFKKSRVLELGAGAGQDSIWLSNNGYDVTLSDATNQYFEKVKSQNNKIKEFKVFDITNPFPFDDNSFDTVYAHLVLHYFDDETMIKIISEIERVLSNNGILACLLNSVYDSEYINESANKDDMIDTGKITKRFFSKKSFSKFISNFDPILFDEKGSTPKDDALGNAKLVRFAGKLK